MLYIIIVTQTSDLIYIAKRCNNVIPFIWFLLLVRENLHSALYSFVISILGRKKKGVMDEENSWFGLGDTKKIVVLLTPLTVWSNYFYRFTVRRGESSRIRSDTNEECT